MAPRSLPLAVLIRTVRAHSKLESRNFQRGGVCYNCVYQIFTESKRKHSMPMHEVMIEMSFSSAHALRGYQGKCENTHGHNYKVEVYVRGRKLNNIGLLIDFKDLKAATRKVV